MDLLEELKSTTVTNLAKDMERPNLVALSYALRHPDPWPKDFVWNYASCDECAMGLACQLWPALILPENDAGNDHRRIKSILARTFAMSYKTAVKIFFKMDKEIGREHKDVMPDDVADAIDAYLKETD